jgi:hypothetical protein|tara:strand:- start:3638 stop:4024 length:387 start_codon:yes stop_codon:yes gene_type:complete
MIAVYQWHLSNELSDLINRDGWMANETTTAYADKGCSWMIDDGQFDAAKWFDQYELVATCKTDDPEEAFVLMNLWNDPDRVCKIGAQVASLSIGDILEVAGGKFLLCTGEGFQEIFPVNGHITRVAAG